MTKARDNQIHRVASALGLNEEMLRSMKSRKVTEGNINEFGRFEILKETADIRKVGECPVRERGMKLPSPKLRMKLDALFHVLGDVSYLTKKQENLIRYET